MRTWAVVSLMFLLTACGDGPTRPTPPPPPPPPPPPTATIAASGNGAIVLHPSINSTFTFAIEAPIQIRETAGGTADWNYARMSLRRADGSEIERAEVGASVISAGGFGRIGPNSTSNPVPIFRFNSSDFDDLIITLGFGDVNHGTVFETEVPLDSFSDVQVSFVPLSMPSDRVERQ